MAACVWCSGHVLRHSVVRLQARACHGYVYNPPPSVPPPPPPPLSLHVPTDCSGREAGMTTDHSLPSCLLTCCLCILLHVFLRGMQGSSHFSCQGIPAGLQHVSEQKTHSHGMRSPLFEHSFTCLGPQCGCSVTHNPTVLQLPR